MSAIIFKFPFNRARGAWSRMPRRSKNGAPEERAARAVQPGHDREGKPHKGNNPLRAKFNKTSFAVTLAGAVNYARLGFNIARLGESEKAEWIEDLRDGATNARFLADEFDKALVALGGKTKNPTALDFFRSLRLNFVEAFASGKDIDQIFDELEGRSKRGS